MATPYYIEKKRRFAPHRTEGRRPAEKQENNINYRSLTKFSAGRKAN